MDVREYADCDATALAALIRSGQVSAEEVYETALTAIRAVEGEINALVLGPWDEPLSYASDGPFAGVPFAYKDVICHAAGVPTLMATRLAGEGITFDYDTYAMERFRRAGFATAGTTTVPEFAYAGNTVSIRHGATRNPWDPSRSVGGSSGGSGAIVGARAVPVAHANDGGGSIRVPAAFNGCVGLKPTRGRVSLGPDQLEDLFGFVVEFAITRTLRDAAAMLDVAAGPMPGDPFALRQPSRPWREEVGADPGRLRIGLRTESWSDRPTDPEVVAAVEAVARHLEQQGHHVEVVAPAFDWDRFMTAIAVGTALDVGFGVAAVGEATGLTPSPETVEHVSMLAYEERTKVTALDLIEAKVTLNEVSKSVGDFFTDWDLLLTPTVTAPAPPIDYQDTNDTSYGSSEEWVRTLFHWCAFTPLFNATGTPAMSLPLGWSSAGLPIGVQLAAPMCDEATLLRLGSHLEQALPWGDRRPAVDAGRAGVDTPA